MEPTSFTHILIVRTDRIGDVVLTLPVAAAVHRHAPGVRIAMMVREYTQDLVRGQSGVSEVVLYDHDGALRPFWTVVRQLRSARFDAAVIAYPRFRIALMLLAAGIPVRIGTKYRWYAFLFNRRVSVHRRGGTRSEAEYNLDLLEPLGLRVPKHPRVALVPTTTQRAAAAALSTELGLNAARRLVILHPGSGGSARDWPAERFGELARTISSISTVLIMGTESERPLIERVAALGGTKVRAVVGRLSLMEYAAFIGNAGLFIANSTGPLHIAAAVGTPVIGFYPSDRIMGPGRWGPLSDTKSIFVPQESNCPQCASGACVLHGDMARISVADVAAAAHRMLRPARGSVRTPQTGRRRTKRS